MRQIKIIFNFILFLFIHNLTTLSANPVKMESDSVRYLDVEISNLILSSATDSGKVVYASPGEIITGTADCKSYRPTHKLEFTQVIVGFDGIGAQDELSYGKFILTAPQTPGIYEVRFRYAQGWNAADAIQNWWGVDSVPPEQATIGLVIVNQDPQHSVRDINDSNWRDWLHEKYAENNTLNENVEIVSTLTSDMVSNADFWDESLTTGNWTINGKKLSNQGTLYYNKYYQIASQQAFHQFDLKVTTQYQRTKNLEKNWWSHSRGFAVLYYVNENRNVEFRYFADIGQLSLYIRDDNKVIEKIMAASFSPGANILHDISVEDGRIKWKINGQRIFEETTNLEEGRLMLTNHKNAVIFQF